MDKMNTTLIGSQVHCISEETMQRMNKAQLKLGKDMLKRQREGKLELVILNPSTRLLPELEYIGNGMYKFKEG